MSVEAVEVMAWNIQDGLGEGQRSAEVTAAIEFWDPHVVTLSEAYRTVEGPAKGTLETLKELGYYVIDVPYDDQDARVDRHNMVALAKPEVLAAEPDNTIYLAGRNAIRLSLTTSLGPIEWVGVHLFDRYARKPDAGRRVLQANALARYLRTCQAAGIAGDFNDMDTSSFSRLLRVVRPLAYLLPSSEPGEANDSGIRRAGSIARRLCSMASGDAMRTLRSYGFESIDPAKQPTMPSARPFADLDHMMARGLTAKDFFVHEHRTHEGVPTSDHRAISAIVQVA